MKPPLRFAVLGLHHDHVWTHLGELKAQRAVRLVGVAEPNLMLLNRCRERFPDCTTHTDYTPLLEQDDVDAVSIYANNHDSAGLAVLALNRGKHVLVEKPMASTLLEAERMLEAARSADRRLMVNWPFAWWAPLRTALRIIREGAIGRIWQVKYRAAHEGPRAFGCSEAFCEWLEDESLNGGGALMDYACYGCVLAREILGNPTAVVGSQRTLCHTELTVEDNGVLLLEYPQATAIAEASWSQSGKLTSHVAVMYGEAGTLLVEPGLEGRLLQADREHSDGREMPIDPLPPHFRNATAHFCWGIESETDFNSLVSAEVGRDTQAILEAGIGSARTGRTVKV